MKCVYSINFNFSQINADFIADFRKVLISGLLILRISGLKSARICPVKYPYGFTL